MMIKWLEDAIYDLEALHQYISQDNHIAANRVAKRILEAIELLPGQPGIGRQGRVFGTRELVVSDTPYIIPYRVKKGIIEILRVFHSSMQWPEEL
ncbi:MAG: type II toxin-antitoxin system RelE/ParE family toxin [Proteobacteria bacterium]|nr:type II toxin-antitoxin system RelE/ParE family toxin [Pseudomonadota bacterium]